ncbi:MAG: DUF5110 domain-containing protein [Kiritimatiellae bacterium]|nr:DUF5110 domain-containing protein [Kiritimatiellia bacterium]
MKKTSEETPVIERKLTGNRALRLTFVAPDIVRVQVSRDGAFPDTGLNRYGFIAPPPAEAFAVATGKAGSLARASSGALEVRWSKDGSRISVADGKGKVRLRQTDVEHRDGGAVVGFKPAKNEDWAGFGDQTRKRLFHRGHVADCHVRNVKSYVPVPFFMSTRGAGVLVNTTHRIVFDMCASKPNRCEWRDGRGVVDYYVMIGESFRELIEAYTRLTGRPKLPPDWSFGLWYICRTQANDCEAVNDALNFRRENIPCDVLGLEPGWMEKNYDGSVDKTWSSERFPIPPYCRTGPHNFFNAIQRMGFHMELWLCCDYDLSYEAERRVGCNAGGGTARAEPPFYHKDGEADPHFSAPMYADQVTQRDQRWFQHLRPFVEQGIAFFKQDGAYQVMDHPDRLWGNGMPDAEMHNLYPLLYAREMHDGFLEQTGRRPVVFTVAGWAGFQAWAGTWTGDTGGRLETLGAMLNTAMVGHSWATNDMEVAEKEGIHMGYLLPWSQINSWNYFRMPWVQGKDLCDMHRAYAQLRARLIPYIYSWARHATRTGYPLMAPLPLEFENDSRCRNVLHEFLLGRDLLVSVYKPDVCLPAGRWKDYWTGRVYEGARHTKIAWPANRGGGLFVREGALIPFGPLMAYRGERPVDEIELYAFPGRHASSMDFYEDDGCSMAYAKGRFAVTPLECVRRGRQVRVRVGKTAGRFAGQCTSRTWSFRVALDAAPRKVFANGTLLKEKDWTFDRERGELAVAAGSGPVELIVGE